MSVNAIEPKVIHWNQCEKDKANSFSILSNKPMPTEKVMDVRAKSVQNKAQ